MGELQVEMTDRAPAFLGHVSPSPKISKGENYLGLPYVILDYPRISNGDGLFFIRSMFWWGNFFSSTLQVSGNFKMQNLSRVTNAFESLRDKNYYVGINANPWVHHFGNDNYKPLSSLSPEAFSFLLQKQEHIKIAAFWPLQEWDLAANNLLGSWKTFIGLVS